MQNHREILAEELERDHCNDLARLVRSGDDGYSTGAALRAMARIDENGTSMPLRLAALLDQANKIVVDGFTVSPGDRAVIVNALRGVRANG